MFLIDNNLSIKLIRALNLMYPGIQHVAHLGLDESDDQEVWEYASKENLHILTKDADFNDLLNLKGFPPKIVWIRSGNVNTKYVVGLLSSKKQEIRAFFQDRHLGILELF